MRGFFREYGLTILSAVVLVVLITMCTPLGETTRIAILKTIGLYQEIPETVNVTFDAGGGRFDTLAYQNLHINDTDIYIAEDTIIIKIEKGTTLSEDDIPKPTKDGYELISETKYFYDDNDKALDLTAKISENTAYTAKYKSTNSEIAFNGTGIKNGYLYINNEAISDFKVGTVFTWHNYEWMVLKIESNQALVVSKGVLDSSFNDEIYNEGVAYTSSTTTLNGQTLNNYYKGSDLEKIMEEFYKNKLSNDIAIVNTRDISIGLHGNEYAYSSNSYNPYVFALSYEEAQKYLSSDQKRVAYNGASAMSYWLRSGERYEETICNSGKDEKGNCINNDKTTTYDNTQVCFVNPNGKLGATKYNTKLGIRPAFWLDLTKVKKADFS